MKPSPLAGRLLVAGRRVLAGVPALAGLVCLTAPASAQVGSVAGTVTDAASGQPLEAILVQIPATRFTTLTDDDGRYVLDAVPVGEWTVRFSWLGYASVDGTARVGPGARTSLDIQLRARPIELAEIRVTSVARAPERIVQSPAAVGTVEPLRVGDRGSANQAALLIADLPGVQVAQGGFNNFVVNPRSFMGLANRRLLVLVDGRDIAANFANSPEWSTINPTEPGTEFELIRGPGAALYGANAFGGVLNIRTPPIREANGTRMSLGLGNLESHDLRARWGIVTDDLRWGFRASGGWSTTRGYDASRTDVGDLEREYAESTESAVTPPFPGFELIPLEGQTRSTPFGQPGAAIGEPDPQTTIDGALRLEHYLAGGGVVTAEGGYTRVDNQVTHTGATRVQIDHSEVPWARLALDRDGYSVMAYYAGRLGAATTLGSGAEVVDRSSRFHLEGQFNSELLDGRVRTVLGASARAETVDSDGTILAPASDGRTDDHFSAFGQAAWDLHPDVEMSAVARLDESSIWGSQFAPRAALVWNATELHSFRVTFGRAYLVPSVADNFVRVQLAAPVDLTSLEIGIRASPLGPALSEIPDGELFTNSAAVPILAIGNPELEAEAVEAIEFGYKGQVRRAFFTADLHYSEFDAFQTNLFPGVHPDFDPWTSPDDVFEPAKLIIAAAALEAVPGLTRLQDGRTAIVYSRTNAGRATQWGADVTLGVRITDEVLVSGNYSHVTIDVEEGSFLGLPRSPNTPEHLGNLSASWARPDGVRARAGLRMVSGFDFRDGVFEGFVPARQTVDLDLTAPLGRDLQAGLSLINALDQQRFHFFGGSVIGRRLVASLVWSP